MLRPSCRLTVALALCLGAARGAHAAEASPEAQESARKTYQAGAQAYAQGHYKDAIDLFLEAARIAPNPAFSYNIGLAYEQLGDPDNALRWYRDYLRELPDAPDRPDIEPRIRDAEQRLRERGVQQVTILSNPEGATVAVDGKPIGVTPWTGELPPGRHKLTLMLRNYSDAEQSFELPSDHAVDVRVSLTAGGGEVASAPPKEAPPSAPPPSLQGPGVRPLTWVAFGLGAAGLGTALGLEVARAGDVSSARSAPTNIDGKEDYDRAKSLETPARVAAGVGAAFAIAGGVLLYFDLRSNDGATTAAAGCSPVSCGATFTARFGAY
jgi:hypothetical protein